MTPIKIVRWNDFSGHEQGWNALLSRSSADRLFLSWDWQATWWEVFAPTLESELFLLAAYDAENALVGIAPLHLVNAYLGASIKVKRLQFIGCCWRGLPTVRTEYLDFIVRTDVHTEVIEAFSVYLKAQSLWDEFVLPHVDRDSATYPLVINPGVWPEAYRRDMEAYESYFVDTSGKFSDYLGALGPKTRAKIYNRRSYLEKLGKVEISSAGAESLDHYFATLNALHRGRWNQDIFAGKRLDFHRKLARKLAGKEGVKFSMLSVSGKPVSVLYNLRAGQREYGIQTGFDNRFDKKISLGLIHMGYLVEDAFRDGLKVFDFVAGVGKQDQYKQHFTPHRRQMLTLQFIRSPWLKAIYAIYDRLPAWVLQRRRRKEGPAELASDA